MAEDNKTSGSLVLWTILMIGLLLVGHITDKTAIRDLQRRVAVLEQRCGK